MCEEHNIPKVYDPASVEKKWYKFWEEHRYFHAEVEEGKEAFSIVIPPPNITGQLHMGHALDNTLQDILIRWHRMMGHIYCFSSAACEDKHFILSKDHNTISKSNSIKGFSHNICSFAIRNIRILLENRA